MMARLMQLNLIGLMIMLLVATECDALTIKLNVPPVASLGDDVTISCSWGDNTQPKNVIITRVNPDHPFVENIWLGNRRTVGRNKKQYLIQLESTLYEQYFLLQNVKEQDEATYTCTVNIDGIEYKSSEAYMQVTGTSADVYVNIHQTERTVTESTQIVRNDDPEEIDNTGNNTDNTGNDTDNTGNNTDATRGLLIYIIPSVVGVLITMALVIGFIYKWRTTHEANGDSTQAHNTDRRAVDIPDILEHANSSQGNEGSLEEHSVGSVDSFDSDSDVAEGELPVDVEYENVKDEVYVNVF